MSKIIISFVYYYKDEIPGLWETATNTTCHVLSLICTGVCKYIYI